MTGQADARGVMESPRRYTPADSLLKLSAAREPMRVAVSDAHGELTLAEWENGVQKLASSLELIYQTVTGEQISPKFKRLVPVLLQPGTIREAAIATFACYRAGIAPILVQPAEWILLRETLADNGLHEQIVGQIHLTDIGDLCAVPITGGPGPAIDNQATLEYAYTSGSTSGKFKVTPVSVRDIQRSEYGASPEKFDPTPTNYFHCAEIGTQWLMRLLRSAAQGSVCLYYADKLDGTKWIELIRRVANEHEFNTVAWLPVVARQMSDEIALPFPQVKMYLNVGAPLLDGSRDKIERLFPSAVVHDVYALTESGGTEIVGTVPNKKDTRLHFKEDGSVLMRRDAGESSEHTIEEDTGDTVRFGQNGSIEAINRRADGQIVLENGVRLDISSVYNAVSASLWVIDSVIRYSEGSRYDLIAVCNDHPVNAEVELRRAIGVHPQPRRIVFAPPRYLGSGKIDRQHYLRARQ